MALLPHLEVVVTSKGQLGSLRKNWKHWIYGSVEVGKSRNGDVLGRVPYVVCVETREISLRTVDFNRKSKLQWLLCNVDTNN